MPRVLVRQANDPLVWLEQKLFTPHGAIGTLVSGKTAIFTNNEATVNGYPGIGAVNIVTESDGTWSQAQELKASDGDNGDAFGFSVARSGDMVLVGARYADGGKGAVYVFTRSEGKWTQTQKLTASDGAPNDAFGSAVAISGDTAIISSPTEPVSGTPLAGAAYIFRYSDGSWQQVEKITANPPGFFADFGISVALDGTTALIGSSGINSYYGVAYIFNKTASGDWTQTAKLEPSDGTPLEFFGYAVALSGSTALVGSYYHTVGSNSHQGAAYVFTNSGGSWHQTQRLTANDGASGDRFGISVALDNDGRRAIVGAYLADVDGNADEGAAYLFKESNGTWEQTYKFAPSDGIANEEYGGAVSLSPHTILIGASDAPKKESGAGYFYGRSDLGLAIDAPASVTADSDYVSQTIATNSSSVSSPAVMVKIAVPPAASFVSVNATQGDCKPSSHAVSCNLGAIKGNGGVARANVTLKAKRHSAGMILDNRVSDTRALPPLTASAPTHVSRLPVDLAVRAEGNQASVSKGGVVIYTINVRNLNAEKHGTATETKLSYRLPAGAKLKANDEGTRCETSKGIVTCDLGKISAGSKKQITLAVKLRKAGKVKSTFKVHAMEPDTDPGNNTATVTTTVSGDADLGVSLSGTSVTQGSTGSLKATVKNAGPDAAEDTKLIFSAGSGLTLQSAKSQQGTCALSGKGITCDLDALSSGAKANVTLNVAAASHTSGPITVTGEVNTTSNDPNKSNNAATASVTVTAEGKSGGHHGGGGGGRLGWLTLVALLGLALAGLRNRYQSKGGQS